MAMAAKVLGLLCMTMAAVTVLLGVYVFAVGSGSEGSNDLTSGLAAAYLAGSVAVAIVLASLGVATWLAGVNAGADRDHW